MPSTRGRIPSIRAASWTAALFSHEPLELRVLRVGHPAAVAEAGHDVILDADHERRDWAKLAMLLGPAARVRKPACSGGRR